MQEWKGRRMARHTEIRLSTFPFFFCLLFFFCLNSANAQTEQQKQNPILKFPTFSVIEKSENFQLGAGKAEWTVKYPPVFFNSEQIAGDNGQKLVRGKDYQINYTSGKITLDKSVAAQKDVTWTITYRSIPFTFLKIYKRDLFGTPFDEELDSTPRNDISPDLERQPTGPGTSSSIPPSQLEYSGSRTFGISVGSGRSLSQNQEFRINVRGNVSENIEVLAMLSDQDLPIQPEGMTEDIQDINQKLIRITHPNVTGTLGDFDATLGPSEFIFFPRALEGVKVEGDFDWGKFHLIPSALPKGQSTSKVIRGEEGRSEYRLDVDNQFVIVKAGSEIVWLNGEKMRRGENNDYIIREYGDPIIEFNSKHLITSNDVIRVDFEYIPEDLVYQQNLYGVNNVFRLPGEWLSLGASYAVEADLDDPEQALVLFDDDDLDALRQNMLDPDGDGFLLTPPQKHTVWGLESRLNFAEQTWVDGELAFSAVDKNTYSTVDRKEASQAWKLIGYTSWDFPTWSNKLRPKLIGSLDVRAMDANFLPVGASSSNRTRDRYGTQYATEGFEDAFLFDPSSISQASDEQTLNLDFKLLPSQWLRFDLGGGRTIEDVVEGQTTRRNNFNWGANFAPRSSRSSTFSNMSSQAENLFRPSAQYQSGDGRRPSSVESDLSRNSILAKLPNLRWNDYRSTSRIEPGEESAGTEENIRKSRQEGSLSYLLSPFEFVGTFDRFASIDDYTAARNRRRNRTSGRVNLVDFKWASIHTSYELEQAFAKKPLLTLDGETLGISDWMRSTTARTWKAGVFSQQGQWINMKTNLARRMVKAHSERGTDTTTQLADATIQLTPFSRAIDAEITYELDKKLTTQRREIYTDIHPLTGNRIQPGEGYYVRLDDLRYVEDPEEGTYIKIYQNVGDRPTTAVDAAFRLRFQPRQFFARRARNQRNSTRTDFMGRGNLPPTTNTDNQKPTTKNRQPFTWFLNALRIQTRLWLTEEQEAEDTISLYLLQSLQGSQTLFGRVNQHHRVEFSPSPLFSFEVNLRTGRTLNRRINTQERLRNHRTWDVAFSVNPTQRLSVGANWEQRRETEKYSQLNFIDLGGVSNPDGTEKGTVTDPDLFSSTPISDLRQFEQITELKLQYELSRSIRWSGIGGYKRTTDIEKLDEESTAKTRTFSFENRLTYSIFGKGRIDVNHTLGYGKSDGGIPFAQYYFYEGISHEVRATADYRLRKFTDLLFRLNYRLLSTKQRKPEHRLEMTVSAEL